MKKRVILNLGYHHVQAPNDPPPLLPYLSCSLERFERQVGYLKDEGFRVMTCREFAEACFDPNFVDASRLPEKVATLSFDDGFRRTAENAIRSLKKFGFPATFFLIGESLEGNLTPLVEYILLREALGGDAASIIEEELLPKVLASSPHRFLLDPEVFDVEATGFYQDDEPKWRRIHTILFRMLPLDRLPEVVEGMRIASGVEFDDDVSSQFLLHDDLLRLVNMGHEIGWHSRTHPFLADASHSFARDEMNPHPIGAADPDMNWRDPTTFAWPFGGEFPPQIREIARNFFTSAWNYHIGEEAIEKLHEFSDCPETGDAFDIPRIDQAQMEVYLGIPSLDEK